MYSWINDRLWRKTRSGPRKSSKACSDEDEPCYGTDPNRNFPYRWGEVGTSVCPCSEVFYGDHPLSEPECAHLAAFMNAHRPQIRAYLTLHSYSNLLMHGCNHSMIPEWQRVGNKMASAIVNAGGEHFKVGCGDEILYAATGSSRDYAESVNINDYVGFVYPEKGINRLAKQILPALQVLAEEVGKSKIQTE
uniref:Peptidase M14 carboxypeptidase A domain-containing protein n=1 Tax=Globodera rostochiensis TaxID=31243 RepID=A0A914I4L4_GLORO